MTIIIPPHHACTSDCPSPSAFKVSQRQRTPNNPDKTLSISANSPGLILEPRPTIPDRDSRGRFLASTVSSSFSSVSSLSSSPTLHSLPASYNASISVAPEYTWPPPPPPSPVYQPPEYDMPDENLKLFWGDGRDGEDPQDFINSIERKFIGKSAADADKILLFTLSLKTGSDAHAWLKSLSALEKSTWTLLQRAFNAKWPERVVAAKTKDEKTALLAAAILKPGDVGKRITTNGVDELSHVAWADKVEKLANAIPDRDGLLINTTRQALPSAVRSMLGSYDTWELFCGAVRALPLERIKERQEEEDEKARVKEELEALRRSSPKGLGAAFRNLTLGTTNTAPRPFQPPTAPAAGAAPPNTAPTANPCSPQTPQFPTRNYADRWADVTRLALPIHPNNPAGIALYEAQINKWHADNGTRGPNETRPYPLSPGSSPVASNECWKCGRVGHVGPSCTQNNAPNLEIRWRMIAASIKRGALAASAQVNLVGDERQWMSKEEYDASVIATYLAEQQGKGDGPSA
ncbi:hypothetical protein D9615_002120 [Tricholomella constricta]|uniref:CCHC-type domain-containing protein n=1 Tax=Tricholomella constricta TaxID=117010 RepID=A0A8H5M9X3_9AGAR|nr:hypothetical protein D9615_002120 [Tricholomella constricta]